MAIERFKGLKAASKFAQKEYAAGKVVYPPAWSRTEHKWTVKVEEKKLLCDFVKEGITK